jgi:hypothetical protein
MTITALPSAPNPATDDDNTFQNKAEAFAQALSQFVTEANALAVALNLNATNDTSTTSNAIGTGAKTFTVSTGKSFQPGMYLVIADTAAPSTNSMVAQVTSYNSSTGALVVNSVYVSGSGTKTAWTISQSMLTASIVGDHEVTVYTGNGYGSTNTKIRRFTTTLRSVGTAITYADSATLGASFTINEPGLYEVYFQDAKSTASAASLAVTLNSTALTTSPSGITDPAIRVMFGQVPGGSATDFPGAITRTLRLAAGDVLRAHTDATSNGTSATMFSIRKVGL